MANIVRSSNFRHVYGDAAKQKYEDIRLATKATEGTGIQGTSNYIAIPWGSGGGGCLAILNWNKIGRLPANIPLIMGHQGPILDFEFNPFDENMVGTASEGERLIMDFEFNPFDGNMVGTASEGERILLEAIVLVR